VWGDVAAAKGVGNGLARSGHVLCDALVVGEEPAHNGKLGIEHLGLDRLPRCCSTLLLLHGRVERDAPGRGQWWVLLVAALLVKLVRQLHEGVGGGQLVLPCWGVWAVGGLAEIERMRSSGSCGGGGGDGCSWLELLLLLFGLCRWGRRRRRRRRRTSCWWMGITLVVLMVLEELGSRAAHGCWEVKGCGGGLGGCEPGCKELVFIAGSISMWT